ncbi:MAG: patatin-like phospholipase family protein [Alphaproteobacteria bacterium]|nr:patatin-like phospholipase family protein [Alphaproteobacteria bacterium]
MKDRAVVLGGGGPVGIAWETGVAAGLALEGVKLADADFILGTSAGSFVGAQLAGGRDPQQLAAQQIELGRNPPARPAGAPTSAPDLTPLMSFIARFPPDGEPSPELRAEIGQFALSSQAMFTEDQFIAVLSDAASKDGSWPEKFACSAVDVETGDFKLWRKGDGVPLPRGVASSCAVPGIYPPIAIRGKRWMDGGMRSATCLDCAAGYRRVICLAVVPTMARTFMQARLDREATKVTAEGGQVEVIVPDDASGAAFGVNLMDATRRADITAAGIAQGRREAERLKAFWS